MHRDTYAMKKRAAASARKIQEDQTARAARKATSGIFRKKDVDLVIATQSDRLVSTVTGMASVDAGRDSRVSSATNVHLAITASPTVGDANATSKERDQSSARTVSSKQDSGPRVVRLFIFFLRSFPNKF